jgi:hypothetical protein
MMRYSGKETPPKLHSHIFSINMGKVMVILCTLDLGGVREMKWTGTLLSISVIALVSLTIAAGRADAAGVDPVEKQADAIMELIERKQWDEAVEPTKKLKELYLKNKWKYQLLGDEEEFEHLNLEIDKLRVAVRTKDSTEAQIILATIQSILTDIYTQ